MSTLEGTWQPFEETTRHITRADLPETVFAFPKQRKEPMTDAQHVRNAVARFDQVLWRPRTGWTFWKQLLLR